MGYNLKYYTDLTGQDLRSMTDEELRRTLQNIAMHVNGRRAQLERAGIEHRSLAALKINRDFGPKLTSTGSQTRGDLYRQIKAGQNFLKSKTSTVSGTRSYMRKLIGSMSGRNTGSRELSDKELNEVLTELEDKIGGRSVWDIVDKAREILSDRAKGKSEELIQLAYDEMIGNSITDLQGDDWHDFTSAAAKSIAGTIDEAGKQIDLGDGYTINVLPDEDLVLKYR